MENLDDIFKEHDELLRGIQKDPEGILGKELHEKLTQMAQGAVREARNYLIALVEVGNRVDEVEPPEDPMAIPLLDAAGYLDLVRTPTGSYSYAPSERGRLAYSTWKENPSLPLF